MFDYETNNIISERLSIHTSAKIIHHGQNTTVVGRNVEVNENVKVLANIGIIRNQYWIYSLSNISSSEEELWVVLRKHISEDGIEGYKLSAGAVIKFGRCRYIVKELVVVQEPMKTVGNFYTEEMEYSSFSAPMIKKRPEIASESTLTDASPMSKGEERQCRICLGEDEETNNKLIESPCLCLGSTRLIHAKCLKRWLGSKVTKKRTEAALSYSWKDFECDICKAKYPDHFGIGDKEIISIINIERPQNNYMILEVDPQSLNGVNMIHVIRLDVKDVLTLVIFVCKE